MDLFESKPESEQLDEQSEDVRREDRKRRNRESAAKCRQKLKDRLSSYRRDVGDLEVQHWALNNEKQLLEIEIKQVNHEMTKHNRACQLSGQPEPKPALALTLVNRTNAWVQSLNVTNSPTTGPSSTPIARTGTGFDINNNINQ